IKVPKVTANIPDDRVETDADTNKCPQRESYPESHRGRDKRATLREANRKKIMETETRGIFWKEIKRLADPKPAPVSVTAASLKDVFERRLNPPETTPPQFDEAQLGINKLLAQLLPEKTEDHTPEGFFSGNWNEDDMGRLKDHLRSHSLQNAE
ncbi:hypothetical protein C8R45DRAFT_763380, partial [Mycena sanguinolenta]